MNKKRNTIIAIIFTIIIISLFIVLSISKERTQADIINEQLKKQNASWIAIDYPKDIMEIPVNMPLKELEIENEIEHPEENIFNQKTKEQFYSENNTTPENKTQNKLTGLFILNTSTTKTPRKIQLQDNWYWKEYYTPGKWQQWCGSCNPLAVTVALEGFINRKYNFTGKNKIDLSEQYLISYSTFNGCKGHFVYYYLNLIKLEKNINSSNIDEYLKEKIKAELAIQNVFVKNQLRTKTQLSFAVGEAPFGLPLEKQLPYVGYDSCEIVRLDPNNPGFAITDMNLVLLKNIYKNYSNIDISTFDNSIANLFYSKFCPDSADTDLGENNLFFPIKRDDFEKYFITNYFKIDTRNCNSNKKLIIQNIKDGLNVSPLIVSIPFYNSLRNYKNGIWEKLANEKSTVGHGVVISGWGVDKISGKEYWILKNNWKDDWGDESYFRTWIGDTDLKIECGNIYGFSGNLIKKSGKEINALLPIAKQEMEQKKLQRSETERLRQENLERQIKELPTIIPDIQINPYNVNINYVVSYCINIENCIQEKLTDFYGTKST